MGDAQSRDIAYRAGVGVWSSGVLAVVKRRGDEVFAAVFAAASLAAVAIDQGGSTAATWQPHLAALAVLSLAATVPFAWRRRLPATVAVVVFSAGVVQALLFRDQLPISFVLTAVLAAYSVGAHASLWASLATAAFGLTAVEASSFLTSPEGLVSKLGTAPLFVLLPWALGGLVARLHEQRQVLSDLNVRLEREQDAAARASVLQERSRIARELHDIVAHSISVMVIQAGAAEQMVDPADLGASVRAPLNTIRITGQQALTEMRRLLGVLRTDDPDTALLAPQPGLAQIDGLVHQARSDGLLVTVAVHGDPRVLPPGIDVAVFRLVQEALSNVRKHAAATSVELTLRFEKNRLLIDVGDDGTGTGSPGHEPGHGLIGMRERVALHGGTLRTGPREASGWVVSARLPLGDEPT